MTGHLHTGLPARDQGGFGLTEVLITILLMGTVLAAVILLVSSLVTAGGRQRAMTEASNRAVNVAEALEAMRYHACEPGQDTTAFASSFASGDDDYWSALDSVGSHFDASIEAVEFLESNSPSVAGATFVDTCPTDGDQGLQRLRIEVVTDRRGGATGVLHLVKRNSECPPHVLVTTPGSIPEGHNGIAEC